jgi:transcriptional regulator with XRE-family HTH domain
MAALSNQDLAADINRRFAYNTKRLRRIRGYTQFGLAKVCGLSHGGVSAIETARHDCALSLVTIVAHGLICEEAELLRPIRIGDDEEDIPTVPVDAAVREANAAGYERWRDAYIKKPRKRRKRLKERPKKRRKARVVDMRKVKDPKGVIPIPLGRPPLPLTVNEAADILGRDSTSMRAVLDELNQL